MIKDLKIAAVALDPIPFKPVENLRLISELLPRLDCDTDIVVLPELFSTGYTDSPEWISQCAEQNSGDTVAELSRLARKFNFAIAGTFLGKTLGKVYNRGFFIEPSGDEYFYDKRHLFSLSAEAKVFNGGAGKRLEIRFRGWNISMIICYDLRFPVWCRSGENPYDLLLVPANWPKARAFAWESLLKARAIENQAFVVGANRSGADDFGDYRSLTFIDDYLGREIGESAEYPELRCSVTKAVLKREGLEKFRRSFPVLGDADRFNIC